MAWVPVVGFWSTTNSITEQALSAALSGGSVKYKNVIVPAADAAAIEDALGVTLAGSVKRGTPDQVRAEVRVRIRDVGSDGGLILAPAHVLGPETPWENIVAFFEAADEMRTA